MVKREGKFTWADRDFDRWCKKQGEQLRDVLGSEIGTRAITKTLHDKVLIPNDIQLTDMIKPQIKINKKKWKKNII